MFWKRTKVVGWRTKRRTPTPSRGLWALTERDRGLPGAADGSTRWLRLLTAARTVAAATVAAVVSGLKVVRGRQTAAKAARVDVVDGGRPARTRWRLRV